MFAIFWSLRDVSWLGVFFRSRSFVNSKRSRSLRTYFTCCWLVSILTISGYFSFSCWFLAWWMLNILLASSSKMESRSKISWNYSLFMCSRLLAGSIISSTSFSLASMSSLSCRMARSSASRNLSPQFVSWLKLKVAEVFFGEALPLAFGEALPLAFGEALPLATVAVAGFSLGLGC